MDADTKKFYELKAEIIQAAAHPIRLAIIEFLADGEQCVCDIDIVKHVGAPPKGKGLTRTQSQSAKCVYDIVKHVGAQRSNVSRHLSVMLKAGVVESRKDGLKMMYSLKTPCIVKFLGCVEEALKERMKSQARLLRKLG